MWRNAWGFRSSQRHPTSSRAYTKRGVRYLWVHNDAKAEQDFKHAIKLNADNAEAHDDLGVIIARRGEYKQALQHFNAAVSIDPTYFKAYHNLAMVYFLQGQDSMALSAVEHSLALVPEQRNSLLLKANAGNGSDFKFSGSFKRAAQLFCNVTKPHNVELLLKKRAKPFYRPFLSSSLQFQRKGKGYQGRRWVTIGRTCNLPKS